MKVIWDLRNWSIRRRLKLVSNNASLNNTEGTLQESPATKATVGAEQMGSPELPISDRDTCASPEDWKMSPE